MLIQMPNYLSASSGQRLSETVMAKEAGSCEMRSVPWGRRWTVEGGGQGVEEECRRSVSLLI